jgi:ketosteroid isomerase-like protein
MIGGLPTLEHASLAQFVREWERLFDNGEYRQMAAFYTEDSALIAAHLRYRGRERHRGLPLAPAREGWVSPTNDQPSPPRRHTGDADRRLR